MPFIAIYSRTIVYLMNKSPFLNLRTQRKSFNLFNKRESCQSQVLSSDNILNRGQAALFN